MSSLVHARVRYFEERMRAGGWEEADESKVKVKVDQDILSPGLVRQAKRRLRKEEAIGEEEGGEGGQEPTWKKRKSMGGQDKENEMARSKNVKEVKENKNSMSDEIVCQISFSEELEETAPDAEKEVKEEEEPDQVQEEENKVEAKIIPPSVVTWTIHPCPFCVNKLKKVQR
ncbi:hypothetical protein GUITHDRAFT_122632 [Guillardia theta CCMP2712]|uniref:Uncharacterized protein n=1 Tax=Guillardia theta (strain CCMP2712) TaxID=905079 RepID=L1I4Z2_GUITC|nr:hypothetical protein GUITHDRAFT_122632 [Guillardia theta CCMP2712]EKX31167.1 hypothetical protein GUITHDRAFT_122632 [Guillardia theta CCMP2712]|eukprot:XP_005818147.1 hypothetical protein GUITHDRAFT_122632 [Guillardia theta CCMP2712]